MDIDKDKMAERILHLTLEILFRLTGQDYTVVKKTSSERCQAPVSEGWGRPLNPITGPPPHPLIHEDINDQKILELAYKMIELLTGEVPIRCQDVAVYFSMEEWEYLEGHRDLYKDVMMEVPQPLTSPGLSSKRTTPERCPHPLLPQDCKQEDPNVPQDHQGEDLTHINTTETYVRGDEWCKEEIPTYDYPADDCTKRTEGLLTPSLMKSILSCVIARSSEVNAIAPDIPSSLHNGCTRRSEGQLTASIFKSDALEITQDKIEVIPSFLHSKDQSSDPMKQVLTPDSLQTTKKNRSHKRGIEEQTSLKAKKSILQSEYGNCFLLEKSYVNHQISCTEEKIFSCSKCEKHFNRKSGLVIHERSHTGEKPYSCSECGKSFAKKSTLDGHQIIHTGEKPFSCSECGKCFAHKSTLVAHERIHEEEKLFSCSECGKYFNQKSDLITHQRVHTGKKPYSYLDFEV
ncbi:uncharacterized protein ACNLHF_019731 isoform 1-T1 [Anomaloglossus baeobatrachus]